MNCQYDMQIYTSYNVDKGPYWAILAVNWGDSESKSALIDFYLLGIAEAPYYYCKVTDLWSNSVIGVYQRMYLMPVI